MIQMFYLQLILQLGYCVQYSQVSPVQQHQQDTCWSGFHLPGQNSRKVFSKHKTLDYVRNRLPELICDKYINRMHKLICNKYTNRLPQLICNKYTNRLTELIGDKYTNRLPELICNKYTSRILELLCDKYTNRLPELICNTVNILTDFLS